jgi:cytochrome c oxidase subunit 3
MTDAATPPPAEAPSHDHGVMPYDPEGAKIGMWLFLFTELLLFGALFLVYGVYLHEYARGFDIGSAELSIPIGAVNTVILLTSSLTMALSIAALQRADLKRATMLLNATLACAAAFLLIKAFEWGGKFEHGLYPGARYLQDHFTEGSQIFISLYFTMTGIHALHVLLGMFVIAWAKRRIRKQLVTPERSVFLENTGLYWHLVDLVWIFLFPLFYLLGQATP